MIPESILKKNRNDLLRKKTDLRKSYKPHEIQIPSLPPPLLQVAHYLPLSLSVWLHHAPPSPPLGFDPSSSFLQLKKKNLKNRGCFSNYVSEVPQKMEKVIWNFWKPISFRIFH